MKCKIKFKSYSDIIYNLNTAVSDATKHIDTGSLHSLFSSKSTLLLENKLCDPYTSGDLWDIAVSVQLVHTLPHWQELYSQGQW